MCCDSGAAEVEAARCGPYTRQLAALRTVPLVISVIIHALPFTSTVGEETCHNRKDSKRASNPRGRSGKDANGTTTQSNRCDNCSQNPCDALVIVTKPTPSPPNQSTTNCFAILNQVPRSTTMGVVAVHVERLDSIAYDIVTPHTCSLSRRLMRTSG